MCERASPSHEPHASRPARRLRRTPAVLRYGSAGRGHGGRDHHVVPVRPHRFARHVRPVTSPPATSAQARTPAGAVPSPTGTAAVRVRRADGMVPALVTGVRVARHDGFDRVVVDFKGDMPGYTVRWMSKVETEGSGKAVDLKGGRALHVMLIPADAHTEDGTPTWTGTSAAAAHRRHRHRLDRRLRRSRRHRPDQRPGQDLPGEGVHRPQPPGHRRGTLTRW